MSHGRRSLQEKVSAAIEIESIAIVRSGMKPCGRARIVIGGVNRVVRNKKRGADVS